MMSNAVGRAALIAPVEWRHYAAPGRPRRLRDQSAATESANLALQSRQVCRQCVATRAPTSPFNSSFAPSGPKRYDYCAKTQRWLYSRESLALDELLSRELSSILGSNVCISAADRNE